MDYFDLHCDTLTAAFDTQQDLQQNHLQIDMLRARCFDRYAQFFAVFIPDDMPQRLRWRYTLQLLGKAEGEEECRKEGIPLGSDGVGGGRQNSRRVGRTLFLIAWLRSCATHPPASGLSLCLRSMGVGLQSL